VCEVKQTPLLLVAEPVHASLELLEVPLDGSLLGKQQVVALRMLTPALCNLDAPVLQTGCQALDLAYLR
jgi:hypothetical protein